MKNTEIYTLIGRILSGEADRQDHDLLQEWLKASEENQAVYENLRQVWYQTSTHDQFSNADRVFQKILTRRDQLPMDRDVRSLPRRDYTRWLKAGVAAAVLLVGVLSFLWLQKDVASTAMVEEKIVWVVKENPAGQKSNIVLSDGTIVWLNAESKMRYPSNFTDSLRRIELTGEAYFEVAKDTVRPFVVASGGLQTTALGTAFNVQSYAGDSVTTVFLEEGSVKVEEMKENGSTAFLEPGWGISAVRESTGLRKFIGQAEQWSGWKDGVLFFDNADFQEVITACERWYNVEFSMNGTPSEDWKFTGKFKNEYLENVLESLRYGKDFGYTIKDKYVELTFKQ